MKTKKKKQDEVAYELGISLLNFPQIVCVGVDKRKNIVVHVSSKKITKELKKSIPDNYKGYPTKIIYSGEVTA